MSTLRAGMAGGIKCAINMHKNARPASDYVEAVDRGNAAEPQAVGAASGAAGAANLLLEHFGT
jgi:Tfp pilus assembly protein PilW